MKIHGSEHSGLAREAAELRASVVRLSHQRETPHLASQLSVIDILVATYWCYARIDASNACAPDRDRVILSKGHAAPALYATLARRGIIATDLLAQYAIEGSPLGEQPIPNSLPGIEAATGSLGHGLSIGAGIATGLRINGISGARVVVVMSDGECNEGSVWEAALFGSAQRLTNLTAIIDYNKWQATGRSDEVLALAPLADKWRAFGWDTHEVDGHDISAISGALNAARPADRPRAIVAHTVKGKGVSFMEDDNNWHYRIPTADEVLRAEKELLG